MNEKFLKITYHSGDAKKMKLNAYLKMPSPTYAFLLREIEICIFDQHKQEAKELRTYWIDEDGDEIEIVNQCDYEIFNNKRSERRHLQVAPLNPTVANPKVTKESAAGDSNDYRVVTTVHERVQCDHCLATPIVGFRYKCIQCPNFDLCELCESHHQHAEHMMVRMPNDNCPNVVEAFVTGRGSHHKRHNKRTVNGCPFVIGAATAAAGDAGVATAANGCKTGANKTSADAGKEHHHQSRHARKQQRRNMQHNIFTHLYNMMQDLAEGGGPSMDDETENTAAAAHAAAHTAAMKAAAAAASATTAAATAAAAQMAFAAPKEQPKNTGATPKTPPPTPNNSNNVNASKPDFTKAQQAPTEAAAAASTPKHQDEEAATSVTLETTTPLLNSPIFENVAQFVDPQYMKAGIQILNNFSEMFAKMLDPVDGNNSNMQCPFPPAADFAQQQRKSSASSMTSSNVSTTSSASNNSDTSGEKAPQKNAAETVEAVVTVDVGVETTVAAEKATATADLIPDSTEKNDEHSRSHSEEADWQIIDKQPLIETPNESLAIISAATSIDATDDQGAVGLTPAPVNAPAVAEPLAPAVAEALAPAAAEALAPAATEALAPAATEALAPAATEVQAAAVTQEVPKVPVIDFAQLNRNLEAHMRKQTAQKVAAATAAVPTAASIPTPEEKREIPIYHTDQRINNAVHAMMAMGFSNEGGWLTQLLESVNGNIPQALDLMSATHR